MCAALTGSDFVVINVSNSKNDYVAFEIKFPKDLQIGQLKNKLEIITGGNASTMRLELYKGENVVAELSDNNASLESYPIRSGMRIHVVDNFSWAPDENVEKFELTPEQYEIKGDTVRNFLKKNNLGKYNEEEMQRKEQKRLEQIMEAEEKAKTIKIGDRCQVTAAGNPVRRGTVMYNGPIEGKKGVFIGVKYDEPLGKNNGSIDGKVYFICEPKYGGFVAPSAVEVGNFPVEKYGLEEDEI